MSSRDSDNPSARPVRLRPKTPCPICGKDSVQRYHPFCSLRCADVDLNRWLSGRYAVRVADPGEDDELEAPETANDTGPGPPRKP